MLGTLKGALAPALGGCAALGRACARRIVATYRWRDGVICITAQIGSTLWVSPRVVEDDGHDRQSLPHSSQQHFESLSNR